MKIVSFNVNGLRPRAKEFGGLKKMLDALDGDIICLQETKVARPDLSADVAMADGYESFFAFPRGKHSRSGWSGVATFCRTGGATTSPSAVLPLAADEGFTGVAHLRAGGALPEGAVGSYEGVWAGETGSRARLEELDQEGRTVVTDHGAFVLFNIYGPCVQPGDDERIVFKLDFYRTLQRRWESLLAVGRRVVVVGDLNIAPAAVDSVHIGPEVDSSPSRRWLQSVLRANGGPFTDTFRAAHPERRDAYTCFSTASGAAAFNYGSRIDLILVAGPCQHAAQRTRTQGEGRGGGRQQRGWDSGGASGVETAERDKIGRDDAAGISGQKEAFGGAVAVSSGGESEVHFGTEDERRGPAGRGSLSGSLEAHLFEEFREAVQRRGPETSGTLATNGRADIGAGVHQTVKHTEGTVATYAEQQEEKMGSAASLRPRSPHDNSSAPGIDMPEAGPDASLCSCPKGAEAHGLACCDVVGADIVSVFPGSSDHRPVYVHLMPQPQQVPHRAPPLSTRFMPELRGKQTRILGYLGSRAAVGGPSSDGAAGAEAPAADAGLRNEGSGPSSDVPPRGSPSREAGAGKKRRGGAEGIRPAKQRSLRELFGLPGGTKSDRLGKGSSVQGNGSAATVGVSEGGEWQVITDETSADAYETSRESRPEVLSAAAGWAALRARMVARHPVCRHGEPAVARVVKKAGPTVGRTFFCCARATGPSSNPEARCDYFEWALSNTARSKLPGRTR